MVRAFQLVNYTSKGRLDNQEITIAANKVIFCFHSFSDEETFVEYQQDGEHCDLVCFQCDAKLKLDNSNFVSIFCEDLREILQEQCYPISTFLIYQDYNYIHSDSTSSQILDTIKTSFSLKSVIMEISSMHLEIFGFEQVMDLLSYINPKSLHSLDMKFPDCCLDIETVLALERWSAFENLQISLDFHTVTAKEMKFIEEILTTCRIFKSIGIHFEQIDEKQLDEIFGCPSLEPHELGVNRYIRVPSSVYQVLNTTIYENTITVYRERNKTIYDSLATSDGDLEPLEVTSDWSKQLDNKTIMHLLLDHLGFIEIQNLRKVCSNIRTCIDYYKPEPNITALKINLICSGNINIRMKFKNESCMEALYTDLKSRCRVNERLVDQDMYETCILDLKTSLSRRENNLEEFEFAFYCNRFGHSEELFNQKKWFLENLEKLLTSENVLLKVKKFIYFANCWKQNFMIKHILWLEPITLELIEIITNEGSDEEMNEMMKEIMDTNQWKYSKEFVMKEFVLLGQIDLIQFVHFSKIDITLKNWTNEDFYNWKEEILYSPSFTRYKIGFQTCSIDNDIYNLLGLPYRTANERSTWYFKMPERNLVLHVNYYTSKSVIFTRVSVENIPEDVVMNFDVQLID